MLPDELEVFFGRAVIVLQVMKTPFLQPLSRLGLMTVTLLALGSAASSMAQYVTDDFNDGNDNGWTHYDPVGLIVASVTGTYVPYASWTLTNGAYRIRAVPSPAPDQTGPARSGSLRSQVY